MVMVVMSDMPVVQVEAPSASPKKAKSKRPKKPRAARNIQSLPDGHVRRLSRWRKLMRYLKEAGGEHVTFLGAKDTDPQVVVQIKRGAEASS